MATSFDDDFDPNEIECPNCGTRVYHDVLVCPKCGLHFYPDEGIDPEAEETGSQSESADASADADGSSSALHAILAILAGWFVSAVIAFLLNFFASRVWTVQAITTVGQALVFASGPLGALAGGYLAAKLAEKQAVKAALWHAIGVSILSLVSAFLLVTYWYDPASEGLRPQTLASWVLIMLAAPLGAWIWWRSESTARIPHRPQFKESQLFLSLLSYVRHDIDTAERLIEYERKRTPQASRAALIQNAIDRLERDRR